MPHIFSIEIHEYLSDKILLLEKSKKEAILEQNKERELYCDGQLFEFFTMRKYLTANIDLKNQKYF
ncbi:MAG: hypothetical protein KAR01_11250 [Desulfocapsa sp.]|nr:hypothetical protein [Desulfocapsa sp.]